MINLLTLARRTASTARAVTLSVVNPAALFQQPTEAAPVELVAEPADLYTEDEMPVVEDIEAAAREFDRAADQARAADRGKRAARKILDRLPAGLYGAWNVERIPSNRQTADLDAIRATYKRLGLGPVPMKASAPSLKVKRIGALQTPAPVEFKTLAGVA